MADPYLKSLLGEKEEVLVVARRHWTVLAGEILSESILTIAIIVLISLIWYLWLPNPLIALGYLLLLLPLLSLGRDVASWSSRQYVVTSRRVIQVQGVLNKEVTDSSLEKVNDVKLAQSFWGRVLGYGDIEILTGSELGVNKLARLSDPIKFKTAMLNAKNRLEPAPAPAPIPAPRRAPPARMAEDADSLLARLGEAEDKAGKRSTTAADKKEDIPALLEQLDKLRQAGVVTEAEFQNKKAQLLSRM